MKYTSHSFHCRLHNHVLHLLRKIYDLIQFVASLSFYSLSFSLIDYEILSGSKRTMRQIPFLEGITQHKGATYSFSHHSLILCTTTQHIPRRRNLSSSSHLMNSVQSNLMSIFTLGEVINLIMRCKTYYWVLL